MSGQARSENGTGRPMPRRQITIWGVLVTLVLFLAPVLAMAASRRTHKSPATAIALFVSGAIAGLLFLWFWFRLAARRPRAARIVAIGAMLLLLADILLLPVQDYGVLFGVSAAWFPHCWPVVGTRPRASN